MGIRMLSFAVALGLAALTQPAFAQQTYKSPEEAFGALVAAAKSGDASAFRSVLGPAGRELVSSGDPVDDDKIRTEFLAAYDAKNQIVKPSDTTALLVVGSNDFPVPIPLRQHDGGWRFDIVAAREEMLYRRIGRNELAAIQACLAYVDAQNEYAAKDRDQAFASYAQRIVSRPGKKDGLYWAAAEGEEQSPLGELVAQASKEGYRAGSGAPFHGYYYKVLTRQGPTSPGGALNYVVRGNMIGGFALVAWPARYGNSGVMTFLVNHEGTVFEKDLGPRTPAIASAMSAFNPDHTWKKVSEERARQ
jgi:hypothetical protein